MKHCRLLLLMAVIVLFSATACLAVYPTPDGCASLPIFQGYVGNDIAWYIRTDTSSFRLAQDQELTYSPKLVSAWGAAAPVYFVQNPVATAKPVFSARPGDPNYSGIWTVVYVTWTDLLARVPLTSEAQILAAQLAGNLTITPSDPHVVVDYSIVVVGQLGGPPQNGPGRYTIPQAIEIEAARKKITLPTFDVNCSDGVTKFHHIRKMIIPDAGDMALASLLGANLAPGLLAIDASNEQAFWVRRGPKPPSELPIAEFCPNQFGAFNTEYGYSPAMRYVILHSNISPATSVLSKLYLQLLIANGGLVVAQDNQRINAPILPPKADIKVCSLVIDVYLFDWFLPDKDKICLTLNGRVLLDNFTLPILLKPKCLRDVILKQGDNIFKITALSDGRLWKLDDCTVGIAFSDACPEYRNLRDEHVELFGLETGESATIIVRAP
jgi:hypothetical protein